MSKSTLILVGGPLDGCVRQMDFGPCSPLPHIRLPAPPSCDYGYDALRSVSVYAPPSDPVYVLVSGFSPGPMSLVYRHESVPACRVLSMLLAGYRGQRRGGEIAAAIYDALTALNEREHEYTVLEELDGEWVLAMRDYLFAQPPKPAILEGG
jgi:hypothetical protein